jgi:glycosyltransferase involved in cell wall biosynthesis
MTCNGTVPAVVIVPVYNHGDRIDDVLTRAMDLGWPVVVVDDGSTDRTAEVLAGWADRVTVLRHQDNLGKGAALLTGFTAAAARSDWAVTLDADGQHDPAEAPELLAARPRAGRCLVLGRRKSMEGPDVPWTSRWGRRFSNFWVMLACGRWLSDTQSGFRLYPLPETLRLGAKTRRFQFEVEIIVRAVWAGLPVVDTPVEASYAPPGGRVSHFRPGLDFWRNTKTFARLILARVFVPRTDRVRPPR